jgi:hypothetical protein
MSYGDACLVRDEEGGNAKERRHGQTQHALRGLAGGTNVVGTARGVTALCRAAVPNMEAPALPVHGRDDRGFSPARRNAISQRSGSTLRVSKQIGPVEEARLDPSDPIGRKDVLAEAKKIVEEALGSTAGIVSPANLTTTSLMLNRLRANRPAQYPARPGGGR